MTYPSAFIAWYNGIIDPNTEGGLSNRPKEQDAGGLTYRGFTFTNFKKFAKADLGIEPTKENFLKLNDEQLKKIYYKRYYLVGKINLVDDKYKIVAMDSVFHGGGIPSLSPKDKNGKATFSTVSELNKSGLTVNQLIANRLEYFKQIPSYEYNKNGWKNRLNELVDISMKYTPSFVLPFFLLLLFLILTFIKF